MSALLLAGGESRRMGQPKALLPWQGTTLLRYHLEQLAALEQVAETLVVLGHRADEIAPAAEAVPRVRIIRNPSYRSGKVSSIRAGLASLAAGTDGIMLLAVDQPRPAAVLRRLLEEHARHRALISVPAHQGRRGHPALFDRSLLPELLAISEESQGIRAVVERHAPEVNEVAFDDAVVLVDLNRPEDLARARALAAEDAR